MDEEREQGISGVPPIGGSALLVMFAVLCLTVFALLCLSSAQADRRLQEASAQAVYAYDEADQAAETILAQLRAGRIPDSVTALGGQEYQYECPISETQTLQVTVRVNGTAYRVLRWQAVSTLDADTEQGLEVWDGTWDDAD